jgi:hypothetical protein
MKFLLRLALSGGIVGCMAATPYLANATMPEGKEKSSTYSVPNPENDTEKGDLLINPLTQTVTINNPYSNTYDKPFEIVEPVSAPAAATANSVTCQGWTWTDGEYLGTKDGFPLTTALLHGRIYVRREGEITSNWQQIYHADNSKYAPFSWELDAKLKQCLNSVDPSTYTNGYLRGPEAGGINCNGKIFMDGDYLGTYIRDDKVTKDLQYVKIQNGLLRVVLQQSGDNYDPNRIHFGNIISTVNGENGSTIAEKYRPFTLLELRSCFWENLPVYPDQAPPANCATAPTITGNIVNPTQTSLQFTYSGNGVSSVRWRIRLASNNSEVASGTTNTTTTTLNYSSLAYGDYRLEIEGNNCTSGTNSRNFKIEAPVVVVPDCQGGPSITSITNITPSTATINFAGTNLDTFSWRILDGSNVVSFGKTSKLSTKSTGIEYYYLPAKTYTFELSAENCKSATKPTRALVVNSTADTRSNCNRGPSLTAINTSDANGLTLQFDGDGVFAIDWKIMQGNTVVRQNRVKPTSATPSITYPTLHDGTFTLQIQGGTCKNAMASATRNFTINGSPLPIHVANFKGNVTEKGVELSWEVVSEKNGEGFEILRLDNQAKTSEVIGKVSLTDTRTGTYKFVDEAPLLGTNYYQLKQIDLDGTFTRSNIISVTPSVITGTVVAPNPATDFVNIQFSSRTAGAAELEIYNLAGIKISSSKLTVKEGKNNHRIHVGKLIDGNYFMKVSHAGESSKLRFVKAN